MRIAAAVPAGGLLAGCALGIIWPELPATVIVGVLIAALVFGIGTFWFGHSLLIVATVVLGALSAGALLAEQAWHRAWRSPLRLAFESIARDERQASVRRGLIVPEDDRASVVLVGVLREDASLTDGGAVSLRVGVQWIGRAVSAAADAAANPVRGDAMLTVAGRLAEERRTDWRRGRMVRATAQLRRPGRYLDPGVADQERALARRGVSVVGTVKSGALVDTVSRGGWVSEAAASLRALTRDALGMSVGRWSPRAAAIVTAIVIGDRTGLDADVQRRLQEAGTYHVIAISGGNIAILAGLTLAAFRLAGFLGRGAMVTAIAGLLGYGYLVTGGASVDRATFMAAVYFAGRAIDLRGPPLNALVLVAGLLVATDPLSIADPAFLLTFGASAAIMVAGQAPAAMALPALGRAALMLGLASVAAEAALFPIGATFFSRVTVAGLLLNFAAIPMMAVAQIAGMVVVPLYALSGTLALAVGWLAALGAETLVRTAGLVDLIPSLTWRLAAPSAVAVLLYYAALVSWWTLRRRRDSVTGSAESRAARRSRRVAAIVVASAAAWILVEPWSWWRARGDGRLHVAFIDVGQGDSAFVRFPRGTTLLVDAGGNPSASAFDVGDRVVGQVLRTWGVHRLDTVLLTHGDADHIGGASAVIGEFRPRDVWEGIPVPPSLPLQRLRDMARAAGSRWTRVQRADEMWIDDVRLVVRHPGLADWERQDVRNDDSVVVELQWRNVSVVLTGDIGTVVEQSIGGLFEPSPLRVLKAPHHGSLSSSSTQFLDALRPHIAVFSAGRSNNFGHPVPVVLARYEAVGAEIFRTDRDGLVAIDSDGISVDVRTFTGRTLHLSSKKAHHEVTTDTKAR